MPTLGSIPGSALARCVTLGESVHPCQVCFPLCNLECDAFLPGMCRLHEITTVSIQRNFPPGMWEPVGKGHGFPLPPLSMDTRLAILGKDSSWANQIGEDTRPQEQRTLRESLGGSGLPGQEMPAGCSCI